MSTASSFPIPYSEPRTIWSIVLQLFYTIIAMLPFYYYLKNLVDIPVEGRYLLEFLPIAIGILLFFIEFQLNDYYWHVEKTFTERDIFVASLKSTILVLSMFYTIFFFIFGYWIGNSDAYESAYLSEIITRTMIQLTITLATIMITVVLMKSTQTGSSAARRVSNRFRRR